MMIIIRSVDWLAADKSLLADEWLFVEFIDYLRTDSRFYYSYPEDLLNGYKAMAKTIDGELPKLFRVLPSLPYGVKPLPAFSAESAPTAYYYPGSFETGRARELYGELVAVESTPQV